VGYRVAPGLHLLISTSLPGRSGSLRVYNRQSLPGRNVTENLVGSHEVSDDVLVEQVEGHGQLE